jgi:hypothetical protein
LLEGLLRHGEQEDGVGAECPRGGGFDILDDVLGYGKVDVGLFR